MAVVVVIVVVPESSVALFISTKRINSLREGVPVREGPFSCTHQKKHRYAKRRSVDISATSLGIEKSET